MAVTSRRPPVQPLRPGRPRPPPDRPAAPGRRRPGHRGAAGHSFFAGRQHVLVQARLRDGFGRWRDTESTVSDQRAAPEVAGVVVHVRDVGDRTQLQRSLDEVTSTDDQPALPTGASSSRPSPRPTPPPSATPYPSLFVELDRFESVADLHGPTVANVVLIEAARRLRTAVGRDDLPADSPAPGSPSSPTRRSCTRSRSPPASRHPAFAEPFTCPATPCTSRRRLLAHLLAPPVPKTPSATPTSPAVAPGSSPGAVTAAASSATTSPSRPPRPPHRPRAAAPGVAGRGELDLVYQPVVDLATRSPVGVEVLLRWRHPRLGVVPPHEFIPVAVEVLLRWRHPRLGVVPPHESIPVAVEVLLRCATPASASCHRTSSSPSPSRSCCAGATPASASCHRTSSSPSPMSSASPRRSASGPCTRRAASCPAGGATAATWDVGQRLGPAARRPGWLATVATAIDTHCVPAESLIIEVAEASLPDDAGAVEQFAGLRAIGVRTAIDHFGTGPTALAHLCRLPVDVLEDRPGALQRAGRPA